MKTAENINFAGIIGHSRQIQYLEKIIQTGVPAHAYFFSGPVKVGKFTVAKRFISALSGVNEEYLTASPDIAIVDAEKITVDDIRKLLAKMSLKSASGNYKIIIIDNANRLNLSSQNVLLKTLEEPKGKAIIILVASGGETLLPTIISRCVKINFNLVPYKEMKQLPSADTAGGRPGLAYDMSNPDSMYRQWRQSAEDFLRMPLYQRLSFIDELVKEAKKNKEQKSEENDTIQGLILMWRILISDRLHNALRMNGKTRPPTAYTKALRALAETEIMLQENINKTLALQHFALSF